MWLANQDSSNSFASCNSNRLFPKPDMEMSTKGPPLYQNCINLLSEVTSLRLFATSIIYGSTSVAAVRKAFLSTVNLLVAFDTRWLHQLSGSSSAQVEALDLNGCASFSLEVTTSWPPYGMWQKLLSFGHSQAAHLWEDASCLNAM